MKIGKIDRDTFSSFILTKLGKDDPSIIVPPSPGIDAGVIDIGGERVLVVAEDPIFAIPGQPLEMLGWYTVHIGASDIAVMGVKPQYMTYSLLMPPEFSDKDFITLVTSIDRASRDLGIAIVGGHTGYYPGFTAPTIGGITVFSIARRDEYVTPAGARPGDDVILTKGPAIETAGILAVLNETTLRKEYPGDLVEKAKSLVNRMSVVDDALIAMATGGVTAMHDATEGGVAGALYEIAEASGSGIVVEESRFIYPPEVKMICEHFGINPLAAIAEGSLLITAGPGFSQRIIGALKDKGIPASVIGVVTGNPDEKWIIRKDGSRERLAMPEQDPFWPIFFQSVTETP